MLMLLQFSREDDLQVFDKKRARSAVIVMYVAPMRGEKSNFQIKMRLELHFQHLSCHVYVTFLDSGAKMTCEWHEHIKNDCCFILFFLAVLLLMLVSSLCCLLSAVKQTLKAQCQNAAVLWDKLIHVFERHLRPRSASGPVGENFRNTLTTSDDFALSCQKL